MDLLGILSGEGISITIDPVNLVLLVVVLMTYKVVSVIKVWHQPIQTDEGEIFSWKHDRRQTKETLAAISLMSQEMNRTNKLISELISEKRQD